MEVDEYRNWTKRLQRDLDRTQAYIDFHEALPEIILGRCPYCGAEYAERIDVYTLRQWVPTVMDGKQVFHLSPLTRKCSHFGAIMSFINLHGFQPDWSRDELLNIYFYPSEVPHVLPKLIYPGPEVLAVIAATPIHRIENDVFVPKYTLYTVAYFSQIPNFQTNIVGGIYLFGINQARAHGFDDDDPETWKHLPEPPWKNPEIWDLNRFVKEGKLLWLDPNSSDGRLLRYKDAIFPYGDVKGRKDPYWQKVVARHVEEE